MKLYVLFALIAATLAFDEPITITGVDAAEIQEIIDMIYHPSTDSATASALEQMLLEVLGIEKPAIVEDEEISPIDASPVIVDESIIVEPGHSEGFPPIDIGPEIIDESVISEPADYRPSSEQVIGKVDTRGPDNVVKEKTTDPKLQAEDTIIVDT